MTRGCLPRKRALAAGLLVALATLCSVLCPGPVRAQSAVQARFFDEAARAAYARGDYEAALGDFFELARIAPSQGTLYNVALCAELTHRDALAYDALDRYLAGPPDEATRMADARARLRAMSARLALVRVTSSHPGATIWVDRRELGAAGTAPDTVVLTPGPHVLELTHPAAHDARVEVVAAAGETREVHVDLRPRIGRLRVSVPGVAAAEIDALGEASAEHHACAADTETALPIGTYRVTVRAEGHGEETFVVQVREDVLESRVATLRQVSRPTGTIVIRADVPGPRARRWCRARRDAGAPAGDRGGHAPRGGLGRGTPTVVRRRRGRGGARALRERVARPGVTLPRSSAVRDRAGARQRAGG